MREREGEEKESRNFPKLDGRTFNFLDKLEDFV
jgi:hypothetical protein